MTITLFASLLVASLSMPQDTVPRDTTHVVVGAYIDSYIAFDGGRPRTLDRAYTTQPARHSEFNVNLAFVDVTLRSPRLRGRLAVQAGTSVQANYAGEPRVGTVSGGELARHLQEATVGLRVTPRLWVDAGVYFSYIGLEGWVSQENPTYTRSLIADFTPYYLSGARLTWQAAPQVTAQVHVMNGWQNIAETNSDKAVGARVDWLPRPGLSVGWAMFVGNEQPDSLDGRLRVLNQVLARWSRGGWELSAVLDGGRQSRSGPGADWWTGSAVIARRALSPSMYAHARVEHLFDRGQVLVRTDGADGFRTRGGSLGIDVQPEPRVLWRTEVRGARSGDAIWPRDGASRGARYNWFAVTSLALRL